MGIYDRDYNRCEQRPQMRFAMPSITPVVKWLLIINCAVFLVQFLPISKFIDGWFSVFPYNWFFVIQPWRYISYQFLHGGLGHLFFNMLGLFFFGPMFERQWGSTRFIRFYLICGATGGILYALLVTLNVLPVGTLVGASGAIYGILAAAAVLYPNMKVYVYGIFPVPMAALVLIVIVFSTFGFISGTNAGGEAAHLAGLATGFVLIKYPPVFTKIRIKRSKGAWEKKVQQKHDFHVEVNRILDKVNKHGLSSLSKKEKKTLQKATEMEQKREI